MRTLPHLQFAAVGLCRLWGADHVAAQAHVEVGIEAAIAAFDDCRIAMQTQRLVGRRIAGTRNRLGLRRLAGGQARILRLRFHAQPQRFAALALTALGATERRRWSGRSSRMGGRGGEHLRIQLPAGCQAAAQRIAAASRAVLGRRARKFQCGRNRRNRCR